MRVLVRHGHFAFYPEKLNDLGRFSRYFGITLVRDGDFYTFSLLQDAPRYSLATKLFLNLPATTTYEGRAPWEVMRENGFVFDLLTQILVPKTSYVSIAPLPLSDDHWISPTPLFQPGLRDTSGRQILSYDGFFTMGTFDLKIIEVAYE